VVPHTPISANPAADTTSETRAARTGPSASGSRAPKNRMASTIPENSTNTPRDPESSSSLEYRGTKAKNPAAPQMLARIAVPGSSAPLWISRDGMPSVRIVWTRTRRVRAPASRPSATEASHTRSNRPWPSTTSPMTGPTAIPVHSASEKKLIASPRRSSGAMSAMALAAPVKKSASPTPVRRRIPTSAGTDPATTYPPTETTNVPIPISIGSRRPRRSANRPAHGLTKSAVTLKAPTVTPTDTSPPPSGPRTYRGSTGSTTPTATK
jgi:hypothetical protein